VTDGPYERSRPCRPYQDATAAQCTTDASAARWDAKLRNGKMERSAVDCQSPVTLPPCPLLSLRRLLGSFLGMRVASIDQRCVSSFEFHESPCGMTCKYASWSSNVVWLSLTICIHGAIPATFTARNVRKCFPGIESFVGATVAAHDHGGWISDLASVSQRRLQMPFAVDVDIGATIDYRRAISELGAGGGLRVKFELVLQTSPTQ
jgi:hypothetical protein